MFARREVLRVRGPQGPRPAEGGGLLPARRQGGDIAIFAMENNAI